MEFATASLLGEEAGLGFPDREQIARALVAMERAALDAIAMAGLALCRVRLFASIREGLQQPVLEMPGCTRA